MSETDNQAATAPRKNIATPTRVDRAVLELLRNTGDDVCWIGYTKLARQLGVRFTTAQASLRRLAAMGMVEVEARQGNSWRYPHGYRVTAAGRVEIVDGLAARVLAERDQRREQYSHQIQ